MGPFSAREESISNLCTIKRHAYKNVSSPQPQRRDPQAPRFPRGCHPETGVRNCRRKEKNHPFEKKIKICQEQMEKVCDSPCFNCPTFCQPKKEFWCEDEYKVCTEELSRKSRNLYKMILLFFVRSCLPALLRPWLVPGTDLARMDST